MIRPSFLFFFVTASLAVLPLAGCGGGGSDSGDRTDVPAIIATPPPPSNTPLRYTISEITKLPFVARLVARNQNGLMAGDGFILSPTGAITMIPVRNGYTGMEVSGINNEGKVIGHYIQDRDSQDVAGFIYDAQTGQTTPIPAMKTLAAVSASGLVAGTDFQFDPPSGNNRIKGLVYNPAAGTTTKLPDYGGTTYFATNGINRDGWVSGYIFFAENSAMALYNLNTQVLRTVPPSGVYNSTRGGFVSDNGKVGGVDFVLKYAGDRQSRDISFNYYYLTESRAFIYDIASGVKMYLPDLPLLMLSPVVSFSINSSNTAAIQLGFTGATEKTSIVYRGGRIQELSTTLRAEDQATWKIRQVFAIDEGGVIFGAGERIGSPDAGMSTSVIRLTPQ
jgi:hypothetical protein